ncbi:MAG TPA: DNA polymerase III subunit delta' [Hyphomicrobiaceae bacterium]|nr:DNA polymerase III subunit delta' [Hyphomicrobiaceae bacterium]
MARAPRSQSRAQPRAQDVPDAEVRPEADRLGDFPHPRETQVLYGHAAAERTLAQAIAGGRLHHAWLLAGRAGIGKATLAYRMARHVLAKPEERDPAARTLAVPAGAAAVRQIVQLAHPGLLVLRRPYDLQRKRVLSVISVDEVRKLRAFLGHTADAGGWRVVIVDSADELNVNAANALLKSLEEPPPRALFLLVTSQPSGLLPTIRSRCRRLDLARLDGESLRQAATAALTAAGEKPPSADKWPQLERLADGSVRSALQLATGGIALHDKLWQILARLPAIDWPALHTLSDQLATDAHEQRFEMLFALLLDTLARLVRAAASGADAATTEESSLAARLIPATRLPAWAELWQAILRDKVDADALNLDRKALILRVFARVEAVARA